MSNLDNYISKLMSSDKELHNFLVDPVRAAQDENGLTKAERSVLRRVLAGISNNSTNGMALVRTHDSYRRSLRLLQNVLHTHGAKTASHHAASSDGDLEGLLTGHVVYLYYGGNPSDPGFNPYGNYVTGYGVPPNNDNTVSGVLANITSWRDQNGNAVTVTYGCGATPGSDQGCKSGQYITWFDINGSTYFALPGPSATSRAPFWFYSINGTAVVPTGNYGYDGYVNPYATYGYDGQSFQDFSLSNFPNSTIFWQCIAPDVRYGFQPCVANSF